GRATGCPIAEQLLSRIATDENLHMVFYRNLMAAALDVDPDQAMAAIRDEVVMPVLRHWRVFERDGFGPRGELARDELAAFLVDLDTRATRFVERRAR